MTDFQIQVRDEVIPWIKKMIGNEEAHILKMESYKGVVHDERFNDLLEKNIKSSTFYKNAFERRLKEYQQYLEN